MLVDPRIRLLFLLILIVLCLPQPAGGQENINQLLLKTFEDSTTEMIVDGEPVRGHDIGNNKFKPCTGDVVKIFRPLRNSDKCPDEGQPSGVQTFRANFIAWDQRTSFLEVRKQDSERSVRLYIPESIKLVSSGRLEKFDRSQLTKLDLSQLSDTVIYQVIPQRIEAISFRTNRPLNRDQQPQEKRPKITGMQYRKVSVVQDKVTFIVEILGEGFGSIADGVVATFVDSAGTPVATAQGANLELSSDNKIVATASVPLGTVITSVKLALRTSTVETADFKMTFKAPSKPKITPFEIKHVTRKSSQFANLYSLVVTNDDGMFASNPNRMSVEIVPGGASNVSIRSGVNPFQMVVDFIAPSDFEVQDVIVTVYDTTDLDARMPIAVALPFKEKQTPVNPNQPTITNIDVLYLQRYKGVGRVKIEGNGFGNYPRPSCTSEEFIASQPAPSPEPSQPPVPSATPCMGSSWQEEIRRNVKIDLVPRNTDLQIKRSEITYIDDKLIDVYFEFTLFGGYSRPFRLASATATLRKPGAKTLQTVNDVGVVATIAGPDTFLVSKEVGPRRDQNLEYRFTVMDSKQANSLFGKGVAESFYVVQLSVINKGAKKVAVPLAGIQAEVEWLNGSTNSGEFEYLEGPPTLPPVPLAGVSGFFDAYNKLKGKKATVFRILDGVAILGTSIIPFVGPGFQTSQLIYTGGVIPGLRLGFGDLSGQQLQNLTSLSWQNVEVISAAGGSIDKYIYIPRNEQVFGAGFIKPEVKKVTINIQGLEVTGFEVIESAPLTATPK
jgi:hypothetical protein